jgi:Trk-type K+ transport system membrane component
MADLRPVGYVIGLLVAALGATMVVPMATDLAYGNGEWPVFLQSAVLAGLTAVLMAPASASGVGRGLTLQQTCPLTAGVWLALPVFGAIPFMLGATDARQVDAVFESMSALTTTGSPVFPGLDTLPEGLLPWRLMLQWFGGIGIIVVAAAAMTIYRMAVNGDHAEHAFREGRFDVTSILTGTGHASVDHRLRGDFPVVVFLGLVGGCAGSSCRSVKVFRHRIPFSAIRAQIGRLHAPNGILVPRFEGRPVPAEVLSSVMAVVVILVVSIGVMPVALGMTGLDFVTPLSGAATAIPNIGPGPGEIIGPVGNFATLNDTARWVVSFGMLVGRLELLAVSAIFAVRFWRV